MFDTVALAASVLAVFLAFVALRLVIGTRNQVRRATNMFDSLEGRPPATDPAQPTAGTLGQGPGMTLLSASGDPRSLAGGLGADDFGPRGEAPSGGELLSDPGTGLVSKRAWQWLLEQEENRLVRYGHPATVVVVELDGLDALATALGQNAAERLILPVATTLQVNARAADVVARGGHTRFLALLPETDEIAAIAYIDRIRTACDTWLEAGEVSVRLAIGWAQAASGGHIWDAFTLAEKRMHADRRRGRAAAEPGPSERDIEGAAKAPVLTGASGTEPGNGRVPSNGLAPSSRPGVTPTIGADRKPDDAEAEIRPS